MFLLLLIVVNFQIIPYGQENTHQEVKASIEYSSESHTKKIDFTEEELTRIEEDINYLREKLARAGVECCAPRRKLGECIWECCDKSQIRTCDPTLVKALDSLLGRS